MEKGRQIQREWSKFPSRNREVSEVFSDRGLKEKLLKVPVFGAIKRGKEKCP